MLFSNKSTASFLRDYFVCAFSEFKFYSYPLSHKLETTVINHPIIFDTMWFSVDFNLCSASVQVFGFDPGALRVLTSPPSVH